MKKYFTYTFVLIVLLLSTFFLGFMLGKSKQDKNAKTKVVTKWTKGDVIKDTIYLPKPYAVAGENKNDTLYVPVPSSTDTTKLFAVWKDYYLQRKYNLDFSNDTIGTFKVDATVGQNKLISATSIIQPNIRTVYTENTIYKVPTLQFYGMIGSSLDLKTNKIQFGIDVKQKFMFGVSGIRLNNNYGYTIDTGIKF
jgi:hypothetical protein